MRTTNEVRLWRNQTWWAAPTNRVALIVNVLTQQIRMRIQQGYKVTEHLRDYIRRPHTIFMRRLCVARELSCAMI